MNVAIVTGATGNLGTSVIEKLLMEGFTVTGTVNAKKSGSEKSVSVNFESFPVDLSNEKDAKDFVDSVISKYGKIDVAVLTVGGFAMGDIAETSSADIRKMYSLNFETAYHVARPVFLQMIKQHYGRIFFVGALPGLDTGKSKTMVAYGLSKSLVVRLSEILNAEAKDENVKSTVIIPGTIDTPVNREAMPDADTSKWVKPEEIAQIIHSHIIKPATEKHEHILMV